MLLRMAMEEVTEKMIGDQLLLGSITEDLSVWRRAVCQQVA